MGPDSLFFRCLELEQKCDEWQQRAVILALCLLVQLILCLWNEWKIIKLKERLNDDNRS